jgi:hypothetical protein
MSQSLSRPTHADRLNPLTTSDIRVCPDCAGPLARTAGCVTCLQCGWGRCG